MKHMTKHYVLVAIAISMFLGLVQTNVQAQTQVKGLNVTEVVYGNKGAIPGATFRQVGAKAWKRFASNGQSDLVCTETGRDEWSVYLRCKKGNDRASSVTLNLHTKKVTLKIGSFAMDYPIVKSANTPVAKAAATTNVATSGTLEQQCFNAVQGKVAYDRAGNKRWGAGNVQKLCKATKNPAATIACFKQEVQAHNSWSRGVNACKVDPTVARATVANSSNTAVKTVTRSTTTPRPSPLSPNEMSRVMNWISVKASAARLPFCWRKSKGRGVGKIPLCPAGYVKEGLICFTPCKANEKGADGYCYRNCPAGFRNDGLYCGKPAAYGRGGGYIWRIGDRVGSLNGARARCQAKNPQGCEKYGAIIYPKCKAGFKNAGSNVCSPICPSGYSDIGVSCKKPVAKRRVAYANRCPAGMTKDPTGDLCYPSCGSGDTPGYQKKFSGGGPRDNYKGVGPVCWQQCPRQQNVDCGAGCATTKGACAKAVFNMTSAPIIAALKIAGLVATAGASTGLTTSVAGGKLASKLPRLRPLFVLADKIQRHAKTYEDVIKAGTASKTLIL
ncbi:MAG: hypothetical protein HKN25_18575, partial [Pyrinomonadaceae bacterium]|nr:hypothetical protein [Pyrinomonadaceae bacterium]